MREQLFACEPNYILGYLDRVENATEEELKLASRMFSDAPAVPDNFSRRTPGAYEEDPLDDIYEEDEDEATVKIEGLLTMAGPSPIARLFGDTGTSYRDIISACNRASASACTRVTFAINSPGGEVAGVDQAWQAIRALASAKPCTAENNGMMASAAYWLASACQRIVATSPACEQGSIGVKQVVIDDSGLRDAVGIKKITIVSKNAPRKGDDPAKKADLSSMQERCDAMESVFISRVAEGRGVSTAAVIKNFGQGAVLISSEAKDAGMIDAIVSPRGIPTAVVPALPDPLNRRTAAASTGLAAETETPAEPAATPETGRKPMTLKELLASDAGALAEYSQALKAQFDLGRDSVLKVAKQAAPIMASAAYPQQIKDLAVKAISGEVTGETLTATVTMFDALKEQTAQKSAERETTDTGETPAQKIEADALLIAKAQSLKINVEAVQAAATAQKLDPMEALKAAIEGAEQLAKDLSLMGPAGTGA